MAVESFITLTEQGIRERLQLQHPYLGDVRSLSLPGTHEKIRHLGRALSNFTRLKHLDLSYNALVNVEGLQHLKRLERLSLYYNCIPSIEEVKVLFQLPALRELDLRLNPLTKTDPHYRPYLVHAMPSLRKLDSYPVRDTERKVAVMQFSPEVVPQQRSHSLNRAINQRSSDQRLASVDRLTKRFCLLDDTDDNVLNFVAERNGGQSETQSLSDSSYKETESQFISRRQEPGEDESKHVSDPESYTQKQESAKSILRQTHTKYQKHRSVPGRLKQDGPKQIRFAAKGYFTPNPDQDHHHSSPLLNIRPPSPRNPGLNLSDPSNPILHPPRLSYSSFNRTGGFSQPQKAEQKKRGSYRKPLEMLLNLVDKHWTGERSLHQNNNFLSQAVQILSMMESDICSQEAEFRTLKKEAEALKHQATTQDERHKIEVHRLSSQLEEAHGTVGKLNEQLRIVLEENVTLQKQLIKLEQQYLKSMMKTSPMAQIKEAQTEVEELRKEIEGLREKVFEAEKVKELANMLQESHRSLMATNECLLGELKRSGEQR
ncbi:centrosomal protein of 72 kDa isoform X3 [Myripristis murdjan]|uniref:centrosomal protein of 72 kDa isoform X3 n=1 Tax=Myripristis murdjan TaxID=586833 RepID=UPI001175E6FB|nr:centrosomal protein of 72 kDa isoform X3 [Myripristis murdjan]